MQKDIKHLSSGVGDARKNFYQLMNEIMKITLTKNEIRENFNLNSDVEKIQETIKNTYRLNFPTMTAKEIITKCDNKGKGGKILYNTWMFNEDFYKKEKTREGWKTIDLDLIGKGKTFDECKELAEKSGGEMLNFAEFIYLIVEYEKETGKRLFENEYTWTSSRASGGTLAISGGFGSVGVYSSRWGPRGSASFMGVCVSRRD